MMWPKFQIWANALELFHPSNWVVLYTCGLEEWKVGSWIVPAEVQPEAVCLQNQIRSVFLLNTRFGCTYYSQAITHTLDITFSRIQINQYIPIQSGHIFHEPAPIHFIHYVGSNTFRVLMYKFTFVVYIPRGVIILTFRCCQRSNTYKCLAFFLLLLGMSVTNVTNFHSAEICVWFAKKKVRSE